MTPEEIAIAMWPLVDKQTSHTHVCWIQSRPGQGWITFEEDRPSPMWDYHAANERDGVRTAVQIESSLNYARKAPPYGPVAIRYWWWLQRGGYAPSDPACDCGGAKAGTTHVSWCSLEKE